MPRITIPALDPTRGQAATPMAFIRAIALAYRRYEKSPADALRLAKISPSQFKDPEARVTAAQMEILSSVAMQELDDEGLGWFSRKLPWGSYGMLCRASLNSSDLGIALKRWCRHHRLLTDDIALILTVGKSIANVDVRVHRELGKMQELCLVTSLRYMLGYASWAIDSRIPLIEARFPFSPPRHIDVYPLMFQCPVQFNSEFAGFSFDVQYLSLHLRRDESDLNLMLQRALRLTVLQYRRDRLLVQRVRQMLHSEMGKAVTAEVMAERLHVSMRTLYRQLSEEDASLQQLKDEARRDRAIDLLSRTTRSVKQVAQEVGFRSEKSFSRAFKQWTGHSPSSLRENDGARGSK